MKELIQELLDSDLSSLHIAKQTGVEQSTIYRLRKGERQLGKLGLDNAEKLYKFAEDVLADVKTEQEGLRLKRASIMGMLNYSTLTDKERQALIEEKEEIEGRMKKLKSIKYIGNMSKNKNSYSVYINVVKNGTDTGYLFPYVPNDIIENDKIDELFSIDHHKPYVQKAKSNYDKNGLGYQIVKLEEGFQKFIELNKEKMKEKMDY